MNIIESQLNWNGDFVKGENKPSKIVLHHAEATKCTVYDIHNWHLARGWAGIGYHYLVRKDGTIYRGRKEDWRGSHCPSANFNSIGVCFEGSYMLEDMPQAQLNSGLELIKDIKSRYRNMNIYGHKEIYQTSCPGDKFPLEAMKNQTISSQVIAATPSEQSTIVQAQFTYPNNARIQGDWFYVRDKDGNVIPGRRVDDGDSITVLNVFFTKQLVEIEYPTPSGIRKGYITNSRLIKYLAPYNWQNNSREVSTYDVPNGVLIGSLGANEKATLLYKVGDWAHVVYTTVKGEFTKSGYIKV
ncbi:N-acetylmuramoyl-L-alanine amidase [Clostridium sp. YIM B02505]|uniref:N-acetylmuramoyl-L-alanine amidase n=1 Tax=Clostridium yunnanense TaxID=2800325 RepID=A0ABS1EJ81_9CLOT|nr:peptidoglycan recognition family protein [Clostridium yunnanense]MBK1809421.1 N-acetylmuramoyl-L-alanine amidase [Clostridium yunnanense]